MSQVDNRNPSNAKRARTDGGRREDDWTCPGCGNVNFSFRTTCNMRNCTQPRPADHNAKFAMKPMHVPPPYSSNNPYGVSGAPPSSMYMGMPPYGSSVFNGSSIPPYDVPFAGGSAYHYNYGNRISGGSPYRPMPLSGPPPYSGGSMIANGGMYGMPPPPMMDRYGMGLPPMTPPPMGPRPGFFPDDKLLKKDVTRDNDWTCPKCGNVNFSFRTVCNMRKCNTPKPVSQGPKPDKSSKQKMPEGSWKCEKCGNINYPFRTKCNRQNCGADKPSEETKSPPPPVDANEQSVSVCPYVSGPTARFPSLGNASPSEKGMIAKGLIEWCPLEELHQLDTMEEARIRRSLAESFTEYTADMVSYMRWALRNSRAVESFGKKTEALTARAEKAKEAQLKYEGEKKTLFKENQQLRAQLERARKEVEYEKARVLVKEAALQEKEATFAQFQLQLKENTEALELLKAEAAECKRSVKEQVANDLHTEGMKAGMEKHERLLRRALRAFAPNSRWEDNEKFNTLKKFIVWAEECEEAEQGDDDEDEGGAEAEAEGDDLIDLDTLTGEDLKAEDPSAETLHFEEGEVKDDVPLNVEPISTHRPSGSYPSLKDMATTSSQQP